MTRHYSPELGYHSTSHALFDRRRRPHHDRAPGAAGSSAERGQRTRPGRAGAPPSEAPAEEGAPVRHRRRVCVPDPRHALRRAPHLSRLGQAARGTLSPLPSHQALLAPRIRRRRRASARENPVRALDLLDDGRPRGRNRHRVRDRFHPGRRRNVPEALGHPHGRTPGHRRDASADRADALAGSPLPRDRGRGVCDRRVGRSEADVGIPPCHPCDRLRDPARDLDRDRARPLRAEHDLRGAQEAHERAAPARRGSLSRHPTASSGAFQAKRSGEGMKRAAIVLAALLLGAPARAALSPYDEESTLLSSVPGTDDGSIAATLNPAQWGILERSEAAFWWSDRQTPGHRREDYGFSMGRALGFSYRHRMLPVSGGARGVGDYQIGLGWSDPLGAGGLSYGFSGPGRSAFGRRNFVSLGRIVRPFPWLSVGSTGRVTSGERQGMLDLGVRPLQDPRLLLFGGYALEPDRHWDDGDLSGGVAVRPIPGLEAAGRWSEHDRFQITLGVTLARTGFRALSRYQSSDRAATNYEVRMNPPVRGMDPEGRLFQKRRFLEMDLKGEVVYQSYRYFDESSLPLRRILDDLTLAIEDPTVGGVAINLSGFDANIEIVWEVREKLQALRQAGKKSVVYIDRPGAKDYYLASAADRVVMDPFGMLTIPGVSTTKTYLRGTLEKLGLGFEEWRYFKYKSALETLSRRDMSEADREQRADMVRAAYDEMADGITSSG